MQLQLSDQGDQMLVDEERDVLRAYKCPAGVWTIGTGLTAASGVVVPVKGMTITRDESKRLRRLALSRNYEPAVRKAGLVSQHAFDGGVLFHWNTGAILRAGWVPKYLAGAQLAAETAFKSWNKAAGKVSKGLVARRNREWSLIADGVYPPRSSPAVSPLADYIVDLRLLGYDQARSIDALLAFQRDHDLNVDGIIGPATRAAIARAKAKDGAVKTTAAGATGGGAVGAGSELAASQPPADPAAVPTDLTLGASDLANADWNTLVWLGVGALAVGLAIYGTHLVWSHRGVLFAGLPEPVKDWFEARGVVLGRRVPT